MNKYIYDYLARLTDVLNTKIKTATDKADVKLLKEIEALKKELLKEIESVSKKVDETSKKEVSIDPISLYKILDKVKMYTIKNGNWYYEGKDLGIKAEAKDGKDGINGTNGRDGIDGRDGKDGNVVDVNREINKAIKGFATKEEVSNILKEVKIEKIIETIKEDTKFIEPKIEIGNVKTIQAGDEASVEVRKEDNAYKLDFYIPRGVSGRGMAGKGVASGGTTGQMLVKKSNDDYDTEWTTDSPAQIQSDWNQTNNALADYIKNKPSIPSITGLVPYTGATSDVNLGVKQVLQTVANALDSPLVPSKIYNLGELTDNIVLSPPSTGTTQQWCRVICKVGATVKTITLTTTYSIPAILTTVANTYYDILVSYDSVLSKWVYMPYITSTI